MYRLTWGVWLPREDRSSGESAVGQFACVPDLAEARAAAFGLVTRGQGKAGHKLVRRVVCVEHVRWDHDSQDWVATGEYEEDVTLATELTV